MSRRNKKRRHVPMMAEKRAREIWEIAENDSTLVLKRDGKPIESFEDLWAWIQAQPRNASHQIEAQVRADLRRNTKRLKEIDRKMEVSHANLSEAERMLQLKEDMRAFIGVIDQQAAGDPWHEETRITREAMTPDMQERVTRMLEHGLLQQRPDRGERAIGLTETGKVWMDTILKAEPELLREGEIADLLRQDLNTLLDLVAGDIARARKAIEDSKVTEDGKRTLKIVDPPENWSEVVHRLTDADMVEPVDHEHLRLTKRGNIMMVHLLNERGQERQERIQRNRDQADKARKSKSPIAFTGDDGMFWLPTPTLRRFCDMAREDDLPGALSPEEMKRINPESRHLIMGAWPERREDGHQYAVGKVMLDLNDPPALELHELPFPMKQFGIALRGMEKPGRDADRVPPDMPIHAGSHSYEAIWRRSEELRDRAAHLGIIAREAPTPEQARNEDVSGLGLVQVMGASDISRSIQGGDILAAMEMARVVTVDLNVSEGLPDWESKDEAWEYAKDAELPFPVTFFDFSTAGGFCPKIGIEDILRPEDRTPENLREMREKHDLTLRAAMAWRQEGGHLTIAPFAWFGDQWSPTPPEDLARRSDFEPLGIAHFDGGGHLDEDRTVMRLPGPNKLSGLVCSIRNSSIFGGQPGWVDLAVDHLLPDDKVQSFDYLMGWVTLACACRVLSTIYALDSTVNIELADAEAPRAERRRVKRAQEKGEPAHISQTVRIRATRESKRPDREGKRQYSHAFWRRGHFAHYPLGTKMADALAERDSTKLVDHPVKGLCRKVYRPPMVIGAQGPDGEERAPVAKSYVWKK